MKRFVVIVLVAVMASCLFAKTWRKESAEEGVGYIEFNHVVVYNDSESSFKVNYVAVKPISIVELDATVVNLSGLRNQGLRIYYDLYPRERKIVVHVAEDKGVNEEGKMKH